VGWTIEYDSNATCACHGEAPGRSIEHCRALKRKGKGLIDTGWNLRRIENNYLHPHFTKYTPTPFFWWFFFRNVMKLYEFRNDTYFLFVRLQILTDHVFTPFYLSKKLRKLTDCTTIRPFNFRCVLGLHILCNKGCQVSRSGQSKVACHQVIILGRN